MMLGVPARESTRLEERESEKVAVDFLKKTLLYMISVLLMLLMLFVGCCARLDRSKRAAD